MNTNNGWWPWLRALLLAAIAANAVGCASKGAGSPPAAKAPGAAAQAATEPADAKQILAKMANFLANTPRFSVNLADTYDVLQTSGEKIEFGETRQITVSRPDGLRVEIQHSDGEKHLVFYDGRILTVFSPTTQVYAQAVKPGGIDEAVTYFLKDLHMRLPLAALLLSRLPAELERRTLSLDYVESTDILGTPAHHLAGRTDTVDYQVWIAKGPQALPLRAVLTYKNADGQPAFRAQFSDWNLEPAIQESQFVFSPPQNARKIAFLAELPRIESQGPQTSEHTGGKP